MPPMRDGNPSTSAAWPAVAACLSLLAGLPAGSAESGAAPGDSGYLRIVAVAPAGPTGLRAPDARWTIYLDGFIDSGASVRLGRLLDREEVHAAVVYFNSPGGHLVEAMLLGRLLRERRYDSSVGARAADTYLPASGACFSACPFAYAGGVRRSLEPGSVFGVHRARNRVALADESSFQDVVSAQAEDYLAEMGVSRDLASLMSAAPHDSIRYVTLAEAERLRLVTTER